MAGRDEEIELTPPQPEPLARALEELLREERSAPDPWWQAGVDETLET